MQTKRLSWIEYGAWKVLLYEGGHAEIYNTIYCGTGVWDVKGGWKSVSLNNVGNGPDLAALSKMLKASLVH